MLTPKATERASIVDICSHWWINEGYEASCLDEAEHLANLTPVRLDLLLSLAKAENKMPPTQETANNEVMIAEAASCRLIHSKSEMRSEIQMLLMTALLWP